jgi:hypothetical protein
LQFILVPVLEDEVRAIGHAAAAHALGRPIITARLEA